jgi:hypothetical protein
MRPSRAGGISVLPGRWWGILRGEPQSRQKSRNGLGESAVLVAQGLTLTAAQRESIFSSTSIEKIVDSTGSYTTLPEVPGVIDLTTGDDTIVTPSSGATVYAREATLNAGVRAQLGVTLTALAFASFELTPSLLCIMRLRHRSGKEATRFR